MIGANKLFWVIFSFLVGIILGYLLFEKLYLEFFTLLFVFVFYRRNWWCALAIIFGILRVYFVLNLSILPLDFNLEYQVKGYIAEEVDVREDKVKYVLEVNEICVSNDCRSFSGSFLVNAHRYPVFEFGDLLSVYGEVQLPFIEGNFDYGKYLKLKGIDYWFKANEIEKVGVRSFSIWQDFRALVYASKAKIENAIDDFFTNPYGDFLKGLLTGSRKGIDVDITRHFQLVGLSHVVAISGYNITLLIVVVGCMFSFLRKNLRILFSAIFIFVFVLLVGASSAVVRAGVMGGVSLLALYFGRNYLAFRALFVTAGIMCAMNPLILIYDSGFQLSFLATLGIVGFSPYLKRFTTKIEGSFWRLLVFEAVASTLISTVMSLPILISSFGGISLVAPLANLLVLPLVSFVMFLGFAALFFGSMVLEVGQFFAFLAYVLMKYIFFVAEFLSGLEFSFLSLDRPVFYFSLFYYFVLIVVIVRKNLT